MKKFTRDRVVPTMLARVSRDDFCQEVQGLVGLSVARQKQQRPCQVFRWG
jgi:hypothetical protein